MDIPAKRQAEMCTYRWHERWVTETSLMKRPMSYEASSLSLVSCWILFLIFSWEGTLRVPTYRLVPDNADNIIYRQIYYARLQNAINNIYRLQSCNHLPYYVILSSCKTIISITAMRYEIRFGLEIWLDSRILEREGDVRLLSVRSGGAAATISWDNKCVGDDRQGYRHGRHAPPHHRSETKKMNDYLTATHNKQYILISPL